MTRPKKYPIGHKFIRNCPTCSIEIIYGTSSQYHQAERLNRKCRKCGSGHFKGKTKENCIALQQMAEKNSIMKKGKPTWNKGLTKDEHPSLVIVSEKRKGKSHTTETLQKISESSKNHWKNSQYRKLVSDKVKSVRGLPQIVDKWRKTGEDNGKFTPLEKKSEWDRYTHLVRYYTNKNNLTLLENSNLRGRIDLDATSYHLDHIVSITDGFNNNVLPEIIGSIHNLRFIPAEANMKKKQRSDMTIEELQQLYYKPRNV